MAISTYPELQAAVATWLKRGDLTARIPEFITLGEAWLNRKVRKRQAEIDQPMTGVASSRFIPLPASYAEALNLWIVLDTGRVPVDRFIDPALMQTYPQAQRPYRWTIDGTNLAFERPCDQAYSFVLRMISKYALSDGAPTNTLLTDAPDLYLAAAMVEAAGFTRDAELEARWTRKRSDALNDLNAQDARSRKLQTLSTEPGQLQLSGRRGVFDITRG